MFSPMTFSCVMHVSSLLLTDFKLGHPALTGAVGMLTLIGGGGREEAWR